jgi:hypothetical protein
MMSRVGHGQAAIVEKGRRLLAPLFLVGKFAVRPEEFRSARYRRSNLRPPRDGWRQR